jgi:hypothetical protein
MNAPREGAEPAKVVAASGGLSWTRVRTPRLLARLAKAGFALSGVGGMLMSFDWVAAGAVFAMLSVAVWPLFIVSYILSLTQNSFPAALEVHADHLAIQGTGRRVVLASREIRSAMVVERRLFDSHVPTVEIELVNGDVLVARLVEPGLARAVVQALGYNPGGARVHATLAKPTRRLLHPLLGIVSYALAASTVFLLAGTFDRHEATAIPQAIYPLIALALYAGLRRLFRAPELTVGDDGLLLKTRWSERFVARRDLALAGAAGAGLVVETRQGGRFALDGLLLDDGRRAAIVRVLEDRAGVATASADRFSHYERAGRPLAEWRAHLGRAMHEASYRANAATVDEAAAVLRSPEASPEQRVGAALALRVAGHPTARIRVAVEGAVDAATREALEAVVDSDDDATLEQALRRLPLSRSARRGPLR